MIEKAGTALGQAASRARALLPQASDYRPTWPDPKLDVIGGLTAALASLPPALAFQAKPDWLQVQIRCHELAKVALDVLTKRFGTHPIARDDDWAQMVAIPVTPQDPDLLRKRLYEESHIEVPVTSHGKEVFVRVSVQGYNTLEDIERLLAAAALN